MPSRAPDSGAWTGATGALGFDAVASAATPGEVKGSASPDLVIHAGNSVSSTIHLGQNVSLQSLKLGLKLSHEDVNGLTVTLTSPSGKTVQLPVDSARDMSGTYDLSSAFAGEPTEGDWKLTVTDGMKRDLGNFTSWSLDAEAVQPPPEAETQGSATPSAAFHAGDSVTSTVHLGQNVSIDALKLGLKLSHEDVNGLSVTLTSPSGKTVKLPIDSARDMSGTYDLSSAFAGEQTEGDWKLTVTDAMKRDTGTLASWSLDAKGPSTSSEAGKVVLYPMPDSGPGPIIDALNSAKSTIDLSCYLITDRKVFDALEAAAKRGVKVRVMMEPKLVSPAGNETYQQKIDELTAAGVQAQATPPAYDSHGNVDHAKFMVIDDKELMLGTGNLVKDGLGDGTSETNRDLWLSDTRPESVSEADQVFDADWARQPTPSVKFENLVVTPDGAQDRLLALIDGAKTRLYVYNQELEDSTITQHLIAAEKRGVDVQVLTSKPRGGSTDHNATALKELAAAGVTAKELDSHYLHAKAIIADGEAFIGSQNFSVDGLERNREMGDVFSDPDVVSQLAKTFEGDINNPIAVDARDWL